MRDTSAQDHFERAREFQAYYDRAMQEVGSKIPSPSLGQTTNEYRRETLHALKRALLPPIHELAKVDYRNLDSQSLKNLEPLCLEACKAERVNPRHVPPGTLKPIKVTNPYSNDHGLNLKMTKYIGSWNDTWKTGEILRQAIALFQTRTPRGQHQSACWRTNTRTS